MTTLQFLLQVLAISLGIMVAAIVISVFEALWNWVRKPSKDDKKIESAKQDRSELNSRWNFEKPTPRKVSYVSYNALRESEHLHAMPEPRHIPDPPPIAYKSYYKKRQAGAMAFYDIQGLPNLRAIFFSSREEANEVLSDLLDILWTYNIVTVADYYQLTKMPIPDESDHIGWTDLSEVKVFRPVGGYMIELPRPKNLD